MEEPDERLSQLGRSTPIRIETAAASLGEQEATAMALLPIVRPTPGPLSRSLLPWLLRASTAGLRQPSDRGVLPQAPEIRNTTPEAKTAKPLLA
jgi:hypothetical protein